MWQNLKDEEGQTLVYVTLSLIVLLAFVALAIDAGYAYSTRRHMQNAADAGALAGAQAMCRALGVDGARAAAQTYAISNGADVAQVTVQQQGRGGTVSVVARQTIDTYLAGIVGLQQIEVTADAQAACGSTSTGKICGFWPIAFSYQQWQPVKGVCGKEIIIIDSDKVCGRDYVCDPAGYISGGARGWLDMPYPDTSLYPTPCGQNCGNPKVQCFMENDYPAPISLPACLPGEPGTKASDFDIANGRSGQIIRVPLFDRACGQPGDPPNLGDCGGNQYYHIIDAGCVEIVEGGKTRDMPLVSGGYDRNVKYLMVKVSCDAACYAGCATTKSGGGTAGDALGVGILR